MIRKDTAMANWDIGKIYNVTKTHREALDPFLRSVRDTFEEMTGRTYKNRRTHSDGRAVPNPLPLVGNTVKTYVAHIVGGEPKADITTSNANLRPQADELEHAVNAEIERIGLCDILRNALRDTIVRMGMVKIGIEPGNLVSYGGAVHDVGRTFVGLVQLEDALLDMSVDDFAQSTYIGDMYWVLLDDAKKNESFYESTRKQLLEETPTDHNEFGAEILATISSETQAIQDHIKPRCRLMDIYIPSDNVILTIAPQEASSGTERAAGGPLLLRAEYWKGPKNELGPYRICGLYKIPKNPIPMSLIDSVMDLHILCKALWLKLKNQAQNQKTTIGVQPGAHNDGQRLMRARDLEIVSMANPQGIKPFPFAGADVGNVNFLSVAINAYNEGAGNPNMLAGQGQTADTATQEVIISRNANVVIGDMEQVFLRFVTGILRDIAWHTWNNPFHRHDYEKRVRGTKIRVPAAFDGSNLDGSLEDYGILVRHFSMAPDAATRELQSIERFLSRIYPAIREEFAAQGGTIDVAEILEEYAEKMGSEALQKIFRVGPRRGAKEEGGMSPTTDRTYRRISTSTGGDESPIDTFANNLNSANRQNAMMQAQTPQ